MINDTIKLSRVLPYTTTIPKLTSATFLEELEIGKMANSFDRNRKCGEGDGRALRVLPDIRECRSRVDDWRRKGGGAGSRWR